MKEGGGQQKDIGLCGERGGHAKMMDDVEKKGLVSFPLDYYKLYQPKLEGGSDQSKDDSFLDSI